MIDRLRIWLGITLAILIANAAFPAVPASKASAQDIPTPLCINNPNSYFSVSFDEESDAGCLPPITSLRSIFEGFEEQPDLIAHNKQGAGAHQRANMSPRNIKVVDPRGYKRIKALDCDNPNSFWYTMRPNFFNIEVDDEWDWLNLINTDRSDFTDTPFSVGAGVTYLETGITNYRSSGPSGHSTLRTLPESLLRYGISDQFELRIKWVGYEMINQEDPNTGAKASSFGTSDLDLGFKYVACEQKEWFPMTTLVAGTLMPSGTNGFSGNSVQPHFNLVNGWHLRRYFFLKHQFGLDYLTQPSFSVTGPISAPLLTPGRGTVDSYHSSISCLFQATKCLGGFAEWYALYGPFQQTTNYLDTGFFFYFTPSIQLDGVIGTSVDAKDTNVLFTKVGFSTRW